MSTPSSKTPCTLWLPLFILCLAQFLASADNVTLSIATGSLMRELNASMAQISTANTLYPLVAGTFMIAGGMLGSVIGWLKTFRFGCLIYLVAELCATLSPSVTVFIWSARLLAGLGGSFMIPSVFGLLTGQYHGKQRAVAFGALGAASGISFALGPIVCGALLDMVGWRWAFGALGGVLIVILCCSLIINEPAKDNEPVRFDFPGLILSTTGLFLLIFGVLQISSWGFITPFDPAIRFLGMSPAPFLILSGLVVIHFMLRWERVCERKTGSAMIPKAFLHTPQVRTGLYLTGYIFFAYSAGIFVVVSFVQIVTGLTAIGTGLLIVPFAITLAGCSLGLPVLIRQRRPRRQCRIGLMLGVLGAMVASSGISEEHFSVPLVVLGLCFIGASMGTIASNAPFLVTSALPDKEARQSGGIQAAARDVGQAMGVALVSMVMLTMLTIGMKDKVVNDPVSEQTRDALQHLAVVPYLNDPQFTLFMQQAGAVKNDLPVLTKTYRQSRAQVTRAGLYAMALLTLLFLWPTRAIPLTEGEEKTARTE